MVKDLKGIRYMFHATSFENLDLIIENGIKKRLEGVYLCKSPEECCRFLLVRGVKHILTCQVDLRQLNDNQISESFDHSATFFKCRAWVYDGDVPRSAITKLTEYQYE